MNEYAPVVIFCYRRKIDQLIESLRKNYESKDTQLFIYSDGFKSDKDKNDVINVMGRPQITDTNSIDSWIYLERTLSKGKYHKLGKHVLKDNNVLILSFNKYGILNNKQFLTKKDINSIEFVKKETVNEISQQSFVTKFLQSVREKMYNNRK